jgi:hypothetical protein
VYLVVQLLKNDSNETLYIIQISFCFSIIAGIAIAYLIYINRLKSTNAYKIEKYLDKYVEGEGVNFIRGVSDRELIANTKKSIKILIKNGITNTLDPDVYYMYLFSLLNGATTRIWAASIMGEGEWIDTREEEEFLRLNINASKRRVLVERIFIVEQDLINKVLNNEAIKAQINKRSDYLKTYIVLKEELNASKPNLLTDIGSGFIAFDDFAIASDVFQDSFIRGILTLDEETIKRNNRIFTNLRDFSKPLDLRFAEVLQSE